MKKGLVALLVVAAFACYSVSYASAPTITNLPDLVVIGDQDPPETGWHTDSNFFVFTDAFRFEDCATDDDDPVSSLIWTFDEGDDPVTSPTRWFEVNDHQAIHLGTEEIGNLDGTEYAAHKEVANNIATSATATFRDIVLSPKTEDLPFPAKDPAIVAEHETGKTVTFYVSDGTTVSQKNVFVKIDDGGTDFVSPSSKFTAFTHETFDTATPGIWIKVGPTKDAAPGDLINTLSEPATGAGAYRIRVFSNANRYKMAGWENAGAPDKTGQLPYSQVTASNWVRGKFYVYAQPETGDAWTDPAANMPAFNMLLANRYAVNARLMVNPAGGTSPAKDIAPSTDPTKPSLYRVDYDPIDVPVLSGTTNETIRARFEVWEVDGDPTPRGTVGMTELSVGTIAVSNLGTPLRTQVLNPSGLLATGDRELKDYIPSDTAPVGGFITSEAGRISAVDGTNVLTVTTNLVPNGAYPNYRIGYLHNQFSVGTVQENRMRTMDNEIYKIRFHVTSTQSTANQPSVWFRARTVRFAYVSWLEISPGTAGGFNTAIARQTLPGSDTSNTSGWYEILMSSPLNSDIRPEFAKGTPVLTAMPLLAATPGQGSTSTSGERDIRPAFEVYDTINGDANHNEVGQFVVDQVRMEAYTQVDDE